MSTNTFSLLEDLDEDNQIRPEIVAEQKQLIKQQKLEKKEHKLKAKKEKNERDQMLKHQREYEEALRRRKHTHQPQSQPQQHQIEDQHYETVEGKVNEFQLRENSGMLYFVPTLSDAVNMCKKNRSIWKIDFNIWNDKKNTYYRLRPKISWKDSEKWYQASENKIASLHPRYKTSRECFWVHQDNSINHKYYCTNPDIAELYQAEKQWITSPEVRKQLEDYIAKRELASQQPEDEEGATGLIDSYGKHIDLGFNLCKESWDILQALDMIKGVYTTRQIFEKFGKIHAFETQKELDDHRDDKIDGYIQRKKIDERPVANIISADQTQMKSVRWKEEPIVIPTQKSQTKYDTTTYVKFETETGHVYVWLTLQDSDIYKINYNLGIDDIRSSTDDGCVLHPTITPYSHTIYNVAPELSDDLFHLLKHKLGYVEDRYFMAINLPQRSDLSNKYLTNRRSTTHSTPEEVMSWTSLEPVTINDLRDIGVEVYLNTSLLNSDYCHELVIPTKCIAEFKLIMKKMGYTEDISEQSQDLIEISLDTIQREEITMNRDNDIDSKEENDSKE